MTPERLAEIQAANADGKLWSADVVTELLAEVDRLTADRNHIARQLADKNDEYDTVRDHFEQQRELCGDHSADLVKLEIRAEDAEAAQKQALAERDQARARVADLEAERDWHAATTPQGKPGIIWAIGGPDGYIMVNVGEDAARREADKWPDRVALWAERTAWRDAAIEEPTP